MAVNEDHGTASECTDYLMHMHISLRRRTLRCEHKPVTYDKCSSGIFT